MRLADTLHDLSCASTEILGELSDEGYEDDEVVSLAGDHSQHVSAAASAAAVHQSPSAAIEAASLSGAAGPTVVVVFDSPAGDGNHTQHDSAAAPI